MSMYDRNMSGNWKIIGIFFKPKENNSAENYSTGAKYELYLRILMIHLYPELQLKFSFYDGDNERKKVQGT